MHAIAYVEINVTDSAEAVNYFTDRWDFTVVAHARRPGQRSTLLRARGARLVISAPIGHNTQVGDWICAHGEGVADVAIRCSDLPATLERARSAGLPVLHHGQTSDRGYDNVAIAGLGSLRHTLIAAKSYAYLPPGFDWKFAAPHPRRRVHSRLRAIDHIAVCLPIGSLHGTADLYRKVFALNDIDQGPDDTVIRYGTAGMESRILRDDDSGLTYVMAEPTADSVGGQVEEFTRAHGGAGVQHLAFSTSDICSSVTFYSSRGVEFCPTPDTYYRQLAARIPGHADRIHSQLEVLCRANVLVAADHGGLLYQIFSTNPHRGGLFYELIERTSGATGFGVDNVIALFAARQAAIAAQAHKAAE